MTNNSSQPTTEVTPASPTSPPALASSGSAAPAVAASGGLPVLAPKPQPPPSSESAYARIFHPEFVYYVYRTGACQTVDPAQARSKAGRIGKMFGRLISLYPDTIDPIVEKMQMLGTVAEATATINVSFRATTAYVERHFQDAPPPDGEAVNSHVKKHLAGLIKNMLGGHLYRITLETEAMLVPDKYHRHEAEIKEALEKSLRTTGVEVVVNCYLRMPDINEEKFTPAIEIQYPGFVAEFRAKSLEVLKSANASDKTQKAEAQRHREDVERAKTDSLGRVAEMELEKDKIEKDKQLKLDQQARELADNIATNKARREEFDANVFLQNYSLLGQVADAEVQLITRENKQLEAESEELVIKATVENRIRKLQLEHEREMVAIENTRRSDLRKALQELAPLLREMLQLFKGPGKPDRP